MRSIDDYFLQDRLKGLIVFKEVMGLTETTLAQPFGAVACHTFANTTFKVAKREYHVYQSKYVHTHMHIYT